MNNEMVDNEVDEATLQESPTVEENELELEDFESAEKPDETPESEETNVATDERDKNWRAVREELEKLKAENAQLKGGELTPRVASTRTDLDTVYLSPTEESVLSRDELKAELKFPELEKKNIFSMAVVGEYRSALDNYNMAKSLGQRAQLPSVYEIASRVKSELDSSMGSTAKKAEELGARKAKVAKASREATVDAEGTSGRNKTVTSQAKLSDLKVRSQQGDMSAVMERLQNIS